MYEWLLYVDVHFCERAGPHCCLSFATDYTRSGIQILSAWSRYFISDRDSAQPLTFSCFHWDFQTSINERAPKVHSISCSFLKVRRWSKCVVSFEESTACHRCNWKGAVWVDKMLKWTNTLNISSSKKAEIFNLVTYLSLSLCSLW